MSANQPDSVRIEISWFARASVASVIAVIAGSAAALPILMRWVDLATTLVVTVAFVIGGIAILASPQVLVISRAEVRDEAGWHCRGWWIHRQDVAAVRWDDDPDIFEPPRLTFVGHDDQVLRVPTHPFEPPDVLRALRRFDWPLEE